MRTGREEVPKYLKNLLRNDCTPTAQVRRLGTIRRGRRCREKIMSKIRKLVDHVTFVV